MTNPDDRRVELAALQEQLDAARRAVDTANIFIAKSGQERDAFQEQMYAERRHGEAVTLEWHFAMEKMEQERDAALERERTLVEAFKSKEALVEFEALFASDGLAEEEDETSNEEDLKRFWLTVDRIAAIAASKGRDA